MEIVKGILGAIIPSASQGHDVPSDPVFYERIEKIWLRSWSVSVRQLWSCNDDGPWYKPSHWQNGTIAEKFVEFRKAAIKIVEAYESDRSKDAHIQEVANGMESNNFGLGDTNEATKEGKGEVEMTKKGSSQ